jgi:glycerophosphoryl diester phosphodiesterase
MNDRTGRDVRMKWLTMRPIAHRGLHDKARGRYENTLGAARAAVQAGFHIEVDLHLSADGVPIVFHDDTLDRLTALKGPVRGKSVAELAKIMIAGTKDHVPTLDELLTTVAGKVGLVLELKGIAGADKGFVEAVAARLKNYGGPVAVMSFDHWLIEDCHRLAPELILGLTAEGDDTHRDAHRAVAKSCDVDFVSYSLRDLPCRFVSEFRAGGRPVITWTVRSPADAEKSARYADQITFEGFDPDRAAA